MADNVDKEANKNGEKHPIQLYCSAEDFSSFISGLLGKPQTISKGFRGSFEINQDHVQDIYNLLIQRINQQNKAKLIQFTAKIVFKDNSAVSLNSLAEFISYREIRPISSEQLHLSWSFLVEFQDKKSPEKQEIDVSFITSDGPIPIIDEDVFFALSKLKNGIIHFRIRHTARTWGADIEALLSGHIKNLLEQPNKIREVIWKHSSKISLSVGVLYFLTSLFVSFWTASAILNDQQLKIASIIKPNSEINQKIDFILKTISSGVWAKYYFSVIIFLVVSIVISVILGSWVENAAEKSKPSFVILTEQSKKDKVKIIKKYENSFISFLASILTAIVTGLIANILFKYCWG
jgi:hypothetical protein